MGKNATDEAPVIELAPELADALAELNTLTGQDPAHVQKNLAKRVKVITTEARQAARARADKVSQR
jgi:hypothetical protein